MSNGKLKAQYNRVRTSVALQSNSIWTKTIGLEQEHAGSNAVVEASLRAPTHGAGGGREARRQRYQEMIQNSGYEPSVTSFEGLVALARAQGNVASMARGACKICGGLGHLTKQCKNVVGKPAQEAVGGAAGPSTGAAPSLLPLLPAEESDLSLSDLDSSSSSESDSDRERRPDHKSKKRKRKDGKSKDSKPKDSSSKHKKKKKKKSKHKKSKHKGRESD